MKKFFGILLSYMLIFTLVGCGGSKETSKESSTISSELSISDYAKKIPGISVIKVTDCIKDNGFVLVEMKDNSGSLMMIQQDCCTLLKEIKKCGNYKNIKTLNIMMIADTKDKYGNEGEGKIFSCSFKKDQLDKINWDNFDFTNITKIATKVWKHAQLEE